MTHCLPTTLTSPPGFHTRIEPHMNRLSPNECLCIDHQNGSHSTQIWNKIFLSTQYINYKNPIKIILNVSEWHRCSIWFRFSLWTQISLHSSSFQVHFISPSSKSSKCLNTWDKACIVKFEKYQNFPRDVAALSEIHSTGCSNQAFRTGIKDEGGGYDRKENI